MGTCFPNTALGTEGHLLARQKNLVKLCLILPRDCNFASPSLNQYKNLQELSWKGPVFGGRSATLREFLDASHERLTFLELDFWDWEQAEELHSLSGDTTDYETTPLIDLILPRRQDGHLGFLPNLQTLSLSAASFEGSCDRLISAFNLCGVRQLRLFGCKSTMPLLNHMAQENKLFKATNVELMLDTPDIDDMRGRFTDFLASFANLEDLFLLFEAPFADDYYINSILRHRETLRRLIYHRRRSYLAGNPRITDTFCDCCLDRGDGGLSRVLRENRLESVGLCAKPSKLRESFQSIASGVYSLRILHLRFTGKTKRRLRPRFISQADYDDFISRLDARPLPILDQSGAYLADFPNPYDAEALAAWQQILGLNWREVEDKELRAFADWAFGPNGFPNLQVIATGDFSHGNRFQDTRTLWCRSSNDSSKQARWRPVEPEDIAEKELIDANMDMLSACPVSPLFYDYGQEDVFPGLS